MATEYISREAAIRSIADYDDWFIDEETGEWVIKMEKAEELLEAIPAADVRPVVHAEWEQVMGKYDLLSRCSECHFVPIECNNFCPCCGADMREERTE
jgi:NADH pyrophosphatase NudC (nudix superfamily)